MTPEVMLMLRSVEQYYTGQLRSHGPTPNGVDWNSLESQWLRFEQLLKICDPGRTISINDYGCGYGALVDYMVSRNYRFHYRGFDISQDMVSKATELHAGLPGCEFVSCESSLALAEYTVASGVFNVKLQTGHDAWTRYVLDILHRLDAVSAIGFAFNMLTSYSDQDRMRPDLYYGDPCFFFDYCKKQFSRDVALLHDYGLYEFTIIVRKQLAYDPPGGVGAKEAQ